MVNKGGAIKSAILSVLRTRRDVVSGEALSEALEVSRVAVWKHIRRLQESGYKIVSTARGYRLESSPDTPFAWEFPEREGRIHFQPSVGSTMDAARDLARKGAPALTVVVADEQTQGRGRMGRPWISERDGLYFTVVTRPQLPPALAARVGLAAAVCLARVARDAYGVPAQVKWPNDVLVKERKLAGILAEMEIAGEQVQYVNLGLGINVNHHPEIADRPATSFKLETGERRSRKALLGRFLSAFEARLADIQTPAVMEEWKSLTMTLGRRVEIVTPSETLRGQAVDLDPTGALLLETDAGEVRSVHYGDCFLRPPGNRENTPLDQRTLKKSVRPHERDVC